MRKFLSYIFLLVCCIFASTTTLQAGMDQDSKAGSATTSQSGMEQDSKTGSALSSVQYIKKIAALDKKTDQNITVAEKNKLDRNKKLGGNDTKSDAAVIALEKEKKDFDKKNAMNQDVMPLGKESVEKLNKDKDTKSKAAITEMRSQDRNNDEIEDQLKAMLAEYDTKLDYIPDDDLQRSSDKSTPTPSRKEERLDKLPQEFQ